MQNFSREIWKESTTFGMVIDRRIILKWAFKKVHESMAWIHLGQHRDNRSAQINIVINFLTLQTARNLLQQLSDDQFMKDFRPRGYLYLMTISQCQRFAITIRSSLCSSFMSICCHSKRSCTCGKSQDTFQSSRHFNRATEAEIRQAEEPPKCTLFHNWAINFVTNLRKKRGKMHPCTGTDALYRP
jgi:hypothetical protein